MKKYKVCANEMPCDGYVVEAATPEQAVEEAKELLREQADDLPWSVEEQPED